MATFQERFNFLYEDSKLSQREFGALFGASTDQVYNWRNGRGEPDSETMKLLATKFNISVDWLVGKSNIKTPVETIAAHRKDDPTDQLPLDAQKSIDDYKKFIFNKYGIKYD